MTFKRVKIFCLFWITPALFYFVLGTAVMSRALDLLSAPSDKSVAIGILIIGGLITSTVYFMQYSVYVYNLIKKEDEKKEDEKK